MIFILIGPSMDSGDDTAPDSAGLNVAPTDAIKDATIASAIPATRTDASDAADPADTTDIEVILTKGKLKITKISTNLCIYDTIHSRAH